jgi:hypothetical protein
MSLFKCETRLPAEQGDLKLVEDGMKEMGHYYGFNM